MGQMADDFVHQAQYRPMFSCYLISRQICQMQKMLPYFDWPRQLHLLDQVHIIKGIGMHEMHTEMEEIFTTFAGFYVQVLRNSLNACASSL
jgi:hypothetical protein